MLCARAHDTSVSAGLVRAPDVLWPPVKGDKKFSGWMLWNENPLSSRFTIRLYLIFKGGVPSTCSDRSDSSPLHLSTRDRVIEALGHAMTSVSDRRRWTSNFDSSTTF